MKSVSFVAGILCLLTASLCSFSQEDCPQGQVCPLNITVRSDGSDPNGICNNADANTIRSEIVAEVGNILTANPTVLAALRSKYLGLNPDVRAASCADIYRNNPDSQNGYYYLENRDARSYCRFDFVTPGGFDEFGWERLVLTDMRDPDANCPVGLNEVMTNNVRYCTKPIESQFTCYPISYSPRSSVKRIYGQIYGIQAGTPDVRDQSSVDIDDNYVDGVSLTYGSPRNHIWTFYGYTSAAYNDCPCDTNAQRSTPRFVGMDYFCESGTSDTDVLPNQVYVDDPIWDGENCELTQVDCCNTGPWFYREFGATFTDSVELRLCTDQGIGDEDIGLQLIELWVQ